MVLANSKNLPCFYNNSSMKAKALPATILMAGAIAISVPGNAQSQACELLCTLGFWQNIDTSLAIGIIHATKEEVDSTDANGATPLHFAAGFGPGQEVVNTLIDLGADVDRRAVFDLSLLNDIDVYRVDYEGFFIEGTTPLHWAAGHNPNLDVTKSLLDAGADINARNEEGDTPLSWAVARNPNPDVPLALLDAGADISARNELGESTLIWAGANSIDVIMALLDAGADVRERARNGFTVLHVAAYHNLDPDVITALLDAGSDINAPDEQFNGLPIHWAAGFNSNPDAIKVLLDAGSDLSARDKFYKGTPFHWAVGFNQNPDVFMTLLDAGSDINAITGDGLTALHMAARTNYSQEVIKALLDAGSASDINARDDAGLTPLHMAARENFSPEVLLLLLDSGADPTARTPDGELPIDLTKFNRAIKDSKAYRRLQEVAIE